MIRLLTLNLNYYVDKHGSWDVRKKLIVSVIREQHPDIVLLQAVASSDDLYEGKDQAYQLSEALSGYDFHFFGMAQVLPDGQRQGSAVIARHPAYEHTIETLTQMPGLDDNNARVVIRSSFETAAGILEVYNAHFSWVEKQSLLNVREALDFIGRGRGMAVVAGDLNTSPDSAAFEPFLRQGFVDAWRYQRTNEKGFTFESDKPSQRIDYFWLSPLLKDFVSGVQIVGAPPNGSARLSDHLAVMLDLDQRFKS